MSNEADYNYCTKEYLDYLIPSQRSKIITSRCLDNFNFINYFKIYYNTFSQSLSLSLIFFILIILIAFLLLSLIVEIYLSPTISKLSKKLKLSQTIAALTLISFANGSPDIFNSILSSSEVQGSTLAIGSLLGAYIFTTSLVIANVIRCSKFDNLFINRFHFLKEIFVYFFSLICLIFFAMVGEVYIFMPFLFLVIYVFYFLVTVLKKEEGEKHIEVNTLGNLNDKIFKEVKNEDFSTITIYKIDPKKKNSVNIQENLIKETKSEIKTNKKNLSLSLIRLMLVENVFWDKEDHFLIKILLLPLKILLFLTIPPYYSHKFLELNPFMLIFFKFSNLILSLFVINGFLFDVNLTTNFIIIIIVLPFGIIFHFTKKLLTVEKYFYKILCILSSVTWIEISSDFILDSVQFFHFLFFINRTFFSMIIISTGNSIGDFFNNGSISELGNEQMALLGCFSGQLFNLLIGVFFHLLLKKDKNFDILGFQSKITNLDQKFVMMLFGFCFFLGGLNLFVVVLGGFKYRNKVRFLFYGFYLVFLIVSLCFLCFN